MYILIIISISLFFFCGIIQSFSKSGRLEDLFSKKIVWFLPHLIFIGLVESTAYGFCAIYLYNYCPFIKGSLAFALTLSVVGVFLISSSVWFAGYYITKSIRLFYVWNKAGRKEAVGKVIMEILK